MLCKNITVLGSVHSRLSLQQLDNLWCEIPKWHLISTGNWKAKTAD